MPATVTVLTATREPYYAGASALEAFCFLQHIDRPAAAGFRPDHDTVVVNGRRAKLADARRALWAGAVTCGEAWND